MEFQKRQFLRLGKRPMAFVGVAILTSLMLAWAAPAQAKGIRGTKGPDKIIGTAKADVIQSLGGDDRVKGRGGRDRLLGGPGADRLSAVDGRRDRVVNGGPGKDVCRVDASDRAKMKGCESVKVVRAGGPGGPGAGQTCASPPEEARLEARGLGAGCAGGGAADLQRSVLRDHGHPHRFGGWVERR